MAFFGLFGKKRKDEFASLEKEFGLPEEIGKVPEPSEELRPEPFRPEPERPAFKEVKFEEMREIPRQEPMPQVGVKDLELLSAKLDSIRLMIDNMNERVKHIERIEEEEVKKRKTW